MKHAILSVVLLVSLAQAAAANEKCPCKPDDTACLIVNCSGLGSGGGGGGSNIYRPNDFDKKSKSDFNVKMRGLKE